MSDSLAQFLGCFERFSICLAMDTEIQIGPTGKKLLPLTVMNNAPSG